MCLLATSCLTSGTPESYRCQVSYPHLMRLSLFETAVRLQVLDVSASPLLAPVTWHFCFTVAVLSKLRYCRVACQSVSVRIFNSPGLSVAPTSYFLPHRCAYTSGGLSRCYLQRPIVVRVPIAHLLLHDIFSLLPGSHVVLRTPPPATTWAIRASYPSGSSLLCRPGD